MFLAGGGEIVEVVLPGFYFHQYRLAFVHAFVFFEARCECSVRRLFDTPARMKSIGLTPLEDPTCRGCKCSTQGTSNLRSSGVAKSNAEKTAYAEPSVKECLNCD